MSTSPQGTDGGVERRQTVRRQPAVGTIFRREGPAATSRDFGLVWNISARGISMLVSEPCRRGELIQGQLLSNDGRQALAIAFEVVHVRKIETGDHFLGGHLQKRLTDDEMRPFLFE